MSSLDQPKRSRLNRPQLALIVISIAALALWGAGIWSKIQSWNARPGGYSFLTDLGVRPDTASRLINQFDSLSSELLPVALAAIVGLLFMGAVRWRR